MLPPGGNGLSSALGDDVFSRNSTSIYFDDNVLSNGKSFKQVSLTFLTGQSSFDWKATSTTSALISICQSSLFNPQIFTE